jgi:hypothetical protein
MKTFSILSFFCLLACSTLVLARVPVHYEMNVTSCYTKNETVSIYCQSLDFDLPCDTELESATLFEANETCGGCEHHMKVDLHAPKGNLTCAICESVVGVIEWDIKVANATVNELETAVKYLCDHSSPPVKAECDVILKDLVEVFHWIINGSYPPSTICEKLGFCS